MPDHSKFAAFILSHGRPDFLASERATIATLRKTGYTGRTYIIIDNEDATADRYREEFGPENVIQFDKPAIARTFDTADTQEDRRTIVFARNACFGIARDLGLDYFLELDDDYFAFGHRYSIGDGHLGWVRVRSFDGVCEAMLRFLDVSGAATVAMAQGGDYMGGDEGAAARIGLKRKAMNSFFCRTDRPITFVGRINEDVNTYVLQGTRGDLFLTFLALQLDQPATQQTAGGMTGVYLDSGTYLKSFYTVMMAPSCVRIRTMGRTDRRLHHSISWDHAVPKIISPGYRKPDGTE
jgi:hypothetical protein